MLLRTLVTLCALALTGCLAIANPCQEMINCTATLRNLDSVEGLQPMVGRDVSHALTLLCNEVEASHTCIENVNGVCTSRRRLRETRAHLAVGDYICDPDNAEDMEEVIDSDCFTNDTVGAQFAAEVETCAMDFVNEVRAVAMAQYRNRHSRRRQNLNVYCQLFNNLKGCMVREATEVCGDVVGEVTSAIWDIAVEYNMPDQLRTCFSNVQASRRALEYMMPAVNKRHLEGLDWILGDLD